MSKYKVGDIVNVRDDLVSGEAYAGILFIDGMHGKSLKIAEVNEFWNDPWYRVFQPDGETVCSWNYSEEMFEDAAPPEPDIELKPCRRLNVIYMRAGSVTICVPAGVPMGITVRHPKDEDCAEIGEAVAYRRMALAAAKCKAEEAVKCE